MSFTARDVKDEIVEFSSRYKLNLVSGTTDTYDLVRIKGTVTESGTDINKAYLQPIEEALSTTPVDYGRYQANFNFDGTILNNLTQTDNYIAITTGQTTGTVTKTYTPSDLKKWGNAKWEQTKPTNTNIVCDVLSLADATLKSNVTSIADLSDIDISNYPSLKLRWTLTRTATSDTSPTVSNPSVTWEGKNKFSNGDGAWEKIADVTLTSDTAQVDFANLGLENYRYIKVKISAISNTTTARTLRLKINDDTGTNYQNNFLDFFGTTVQGTASAVNTYGTLGSASLPRTSDFDFATIEIDIDNTRQTYSKNITYRILYDMSATTENYIGSIFWKNATSLINKLSFFSSADYIKTGSIFTLMGVK
jgi:hypothetical protein